MDGEREQVVNTAPAALDCLVQLVTDPAAPDI